MAYSNETSSVKTIVPGAEVSGFCDVVARQKIGEVSAEVPKLSAGEGIGLSTVNGKTVITNKISAGENISLVYDQETNTYRIDGEGGSVEGLYVPLSATECCIGDSNTANISSFSQGKANSAEYYSLAQGYANSSFYTSMSQGVNNISIWNSLSQGNNTTAKTDSFAQGDDISALLRSLAQGFFCRADEKSFAQGNACYAHSSSLAQGQRVSALGASLAQGMSNYSNDRSQTFGEGNTAMVTSFAAGYKCTAANMSQALGYGLCTTNTGLAIGKYNNISTAAFVIGVGANSAERKDAFIVNHDGSVSAAGKISANGVELGAGKIYTGVAPIQVNNTTDQISITGESLSAGPGIDMFSSGGYVVVSSTGKELSAGPGIDLFESGGYFVMSATGAGGAGGTSAYYLTGSTNIFEDTMTINSDGVVTLGSYTPGQLVPTTNLTSDEGKFPMIYCRDGRSYYLLERVRQLPYYNAQTNGVVGMSAGSPAWVPMPNCYCIKLNNLTTSVDLSDYSAYDKVTVVHSQEGGDDCHLYWNGKTKVIHSANYCELVKVLDNNNNIKWTFTTSGWTNDNWWDWD